MDSDAHDRLEPRVRHLEEWRAEHNGRINTLWSGQTDTNKAVALILQEHTRDIGRLNLKFYWFVGFSAAIGSMSGMGFAMFLAYIKP